IFMGFPCSVPGRGAIGRAGAALPYHSKSTDEQRSAAGHRRRPMNDEAKAILDQDLDPTETREWIEALTAIIGADGPERAHYILERMVDETRRAGGHIPFQPTTAYVNTIPPQQEAKSPRDAALEWKIRSILRWNAMAMVVRANRRLGDLGGHISSFASSATLYDVGFNHFLRAPSASHPGHLVF